MVPVSELSLRERARTLHELYELVEALDRRVPQVERAGELAIAGAAATLRAEAVKRIAELEAGAVPSDTEES
jgi:hypothetical protein